MMSIDDIERSGPDDEELFAGLRRSVAGAAMTTGFTEVEALGRRTRRRHRAVQAGIGTSAAALVAAVAVLAPATDAGPGSASARGATAATGQRLAPGQTLDIQDAGFSLSAKGDGKVTISLRDMFEPGKLQSALASIGIPSRIERITVPAGWTPATAFCKPQTPQQFYDDAAIRAFTVTHRNNGSDSDIVTIDAAGVPAGDVFVLEAVTVSGSDKTFSGVAIYKHDPGPCVPANKSVKVQ